MAALAAGGGPSVAHESLLASVAVIVGSVLG